MNLKSQIFLDNHCWDSINLLPRKGIFLPAIGLVYFFWFLSKTIGKRNSKKSEETKEETPNDAREGTLITDEMIRETEILTIEETIAETEILTIEGTIAEIEMNGSMTRETRDETIGSPIIVGEVMLNAPHDMI